MTGATESIDQSLARILAAEARPLGIEALMEHFPHLGRRTVQRHLRGMVARGRVAKVGHGRATQYALNQAIEPTTFVSKTKFHTAAAEAYVTTSTGGSQVRRLVRRPFEERIPIGYDGELLERYRPGESFYLDREVRAHLTRIGRVDVDPRPAGTYARSILDRLLIDLSWASSKLEGNTYSLLDTQRLIEHGLEAEGKDLVEAQMILNHKSAIELLVDNAEDIGFNRYTILNLHALLSENLLLDPRASGRLRVGLVGITNSVFRPLNLPQEIERMFDLLLEKATAISDPFEQAFFGMVHIPYLQPFDDVNKRVSRLAANIPLVQHNLCPLSFVEVPERAYVEGTLGVYELGRIELLRDVFIWAYERSCYQYTALRETVGEPNPTRLAYREQIRSGVAAIVRRTLPPTKDAVLAWVDETGVDAAAQPTVVEMIMADLGRLHLGNIARYRLRPSELDAWLDDHKRP